ncbi:MAG: relaxase/mobilization nuclease domain-containing protein [Phoenicibacter congonensis]|uniref:Relaxase/mobilization nuclease domain-containing protein n=1 Tax=Phoenicibacter congonensis TaxID=1944646 RepID=A0AA43RKK4_9ACTN|nr:relaxase/mobilization nuclease domain-containing protein [Phoenicibacter congonensis]
MAVTKIWDIRGNLSNSLRYVQNAEKTYNPDFDSDLQTLGDVMSYAENEEKTEKKYYVSALNCNTTCAREQFINVKKTFDKEGGIIAYHAYQSFAPDETTPEQAHRIGVELAERLWGDRFQVIVATHLNSHCLHNHFVINSVSFRDGGRYHDCRDTYRILRQTSDEICKAHGLSVVEKPHKYEREEIYEAMASRAGMPTRLNRAREAIDEAISKSCTMREFEMYLRRLGYSTQFNPKRKYWTITPAGNTKPIRLARLGEEYTNERIMERVRENPQTVRMQTFQRGSGRQTQYLLLTRKDRIKKVGGFKGRYLRLCYELGYLPKYRQKPNNIHHLLKDELMKMDEISRQTRFLCRENITSAEELQLSTEHRQLEVKRLTDKRDELRKEIRRKIPVEQKELCREQISEITGQLKLLREELKLCEGIRQRSEEIREKLEVIDKEERKEMSR